MAQNYNDIAKYMTMDCSEEEILDHELMDELDREEIEAKIRQSLEVSQRVDKLKWNIEQDQQELDELCKSQAYKRVKYLDRFNALLDKLEIAPKTKNNVPIHF